MDAVFLISVKAQLRDGLGCQAYRCAVTACLFYCSSLTPSRDDQLHFSSIRSAAVLHLNAKRHLGGVLWLLYIEVKRVTPNVARDKSGSA